MNSRKLILVGCLAVFGTFFTARAMADQWDKPTRVTFNSPVEVPGAGILQPGTYVFTVLPESNGNIVQIWDGDHTRLYATALTATDYGLHPADNPVLMFEAGPSGVPALRAFFYPGDQYGRVFVYPRDKAAELAKRTNQPVLQMPNEAASNLTQSAKSGHDAPAAASEIVIIKAIKPTGEEVGKDQAVQSTPN